MVKSEWQTCQGGGAGETFAKFASVQLQHHSRQAPLGLAVPTPPCGLGQVQWFLPTNPQNLPGRKTDRLGRRFKLGVLDRFEDFTPHLPLAFKYSGNSDPFVGQPYSGSRDVDELAT